jgi:phospholipid/cholesterol/gamma-HCH transport system substrate-binding protein
MAQRKQVALSEIKVGILITVALAIFSAVILQRSWGIQILARMEKAVTYLPDVGGLKPGAPVWLAGIEIGRVREVSIVPPETYQGNEPVFRRIAEIRKAIDGVDPKDPNAAKIQSDLQNQLRDVKQQLYFVEVKLEIRPQYLNRISRDSEVSIESRGLIGDSFIDISPGTYGELPVKQGDYYLIEGTPTTGFREIMTGANDVIANFGVLSDQVKNIALRVNPDKIGTGMADTMKEVQSALREARATLNGASELMEELRRGKGTIGRMVADPGVYERLLSALERFNRIAEDLQTGPGTMSRLLKDPQLYDSARDALRKADVMMDRIEKGEGTLGRLSKDDQLYERTRLALEKFASFVDEIESGQGTMGKLLKDPSLYNNLNQSTAEITKLIYDLRQDPKKYLTIRFRLF